MSHWSRGSTGGCVPGSLLLLCLRGPNNRSNPDSRSPELFKRSTAAEVETRPDPWVGGVRESANVLPEIPRLAAVTPPSTLPRLARESGQRSPRTAGDHRCTQIRAVGGGSNDARCHLSDALDQWEVRTPQLPTMVEETYRRFIDGVLSEGRFGSRELEGSNALFEACGLTAPEFDEAYRGKEQVLRFIESCTLTGKFPVSGDRSLKLDAGEDAHVHIAQVGLLGADPTYHVRFTAPPSVGAFGLSLAIGKGEGRLEPGPPQSTVEDRGDLWLTSARVIFLGTTGTLAIRLADLLRVEHSKGILHLNSSAGQTARFALDDEVAPSIASVIEALERRSRGD